MRVKIHEKLRVGETLYEDQNGKGVVFNFLPDGIKCVALERNTNFGSGFFVSSVARLIIYGDKTEIGGSLGKQGGEMIWEFLKEN